MTALAATLHVVVRRTGAMPAHRILGLLAMLGAPVSLVFWTPPAKTDATANLLMLVYLAGWACSAVGLRRLRATGHGAVARLLFVVQLALLALASCQQLQDQTGLRPLGDAFYHASDLAWPLSHLLMLAVFAAVRRARVLTGWRRWTPLACGLALPLTLAVASAGLPHPGIVFCIGTASSFFALGLAVCTARPSAPRLRLVTSRAA